LKQVPIPKDPTAPESAAYGAQLLAINTQGSFVGMGGWSDISGTGTPGANAYYWPTARTGTTLVSSLQSGDFIYPTSINDIGVVVGINSGTRRWFIYADGAFQYFDPIGLSYFWPYHVNNAGDILGMACKSACSAYLYSKGSFVLISDIVGIGGMNSKSEVLISNGTGYIWSNDLGLRSINSLANEADGWDFKFPYQINDSGYIIGEALHNGAGTYFLLVPEQ
jgi:hypothetical protein